MNVNLNCEIVRDLLPSYADGLTSDATNKAVDEHLATCPDCAEALRLMREPEPPQNPQTAEVDYLKKVRLRTSRVGTISGVVMLLIGMFLIFARVFLIGNAANATDATFNITVAGNTVSVTGTLVSSSEGLSRITFDESAGIVNITLYTAPRSFITPNSFTATYASHNDAIGMVRCGNEVLWRGDGERGTGTLRE